MRDNIENSPLALASKIGYYKIAKWLLIYNANEEN